jgi:hypothetical protein
METATIRMDGHSTTLVKDENEEIIVLIDGNEYVPKDNSNYVQYNYEKTFRKGYILGMISGLILCTFFVTIIFF